MSVQWNNYSNLQKVHLLRHHLWNVGIMTPLVLQYLANYSTRAVIWPHHEYEICTQWWGKDFYYLSFFSLTDIYEPYQNCCISQTIETLHSFWPGNCDIFHEGRKYWSDKVIMNNQSLPLTISKILIIHYFFKRHICRDILLNMSKP